MTFGCCADAENAIEDTSTANALTERTMRARTECNIERIPFLPNPSKRWDFLLLAGPRLPLSGQPREECAAVLSALRNRLEVVDSHSVSQPGKVSRLRDERSRRLGIARRPPIGGDLCGVVCQERAQLLDELGVCSS